MPPVHSPALRSLDRLPYVVLARILDLLSWTSPTSLAQLSLVSPTLHSLARRSQYECITLNLSADNRANLARRCAHIESTGLQSAVREVVLVETRSAKPDENGPKTCVELVCRLLPMLSGLTAVEYRGIGIPNEILNVLQRAPHVTLCTPVPEVTEPSSRSHHLSRLDGNVNLRKLVVKVTWFEADDCLRVMHPLKRVLLSCTNLKSLSLDISQPTSGCVVYGPPMKYAGLGFQNGERPPALEELALINYPFGHESKQGGIVHDFNSQEYPESGEEIDYWAHVFDWSRLRRLKTGYNDFALKAMVHFTGLKEVETSEKWFADDVSQFYLELPSSLTAIGVPLFKAVGREGLLRHAATLTKLHIHRRESYHSSWEESAVPLESLRQIQRECRLIAELSLDLARCESWPYSTFDVLATFPRLRVLQIWFEIGIDDPQHPLKPAVTFSAAEHIFDYIRSHFPGERSPVQKLILHSGAPPPMPSGFPSPDAFWPMYNSTSFVCQLSERDDEAAAGVFSVSCPELTGHTHRVPPQQESSPARMVKPDNRSSPSSLALGRIWRSLGNVKQRRKHTQTGKDAVDTLVKQRHDEAWLVAHQGPRSRAEWSAHY